MRQYRSKWRRWNAAITPEQAAWINAVVHNTPWNGSDLLQELINAGQKRDPHELRLAIERRRAQEKLEAAKKEWDRLTGAPANNRPRKTPV